MIKTANGKPLFFHKECWEMMQKGDYLAFHHGELRKGSFQQTVWLFIVRDGIQLGNFLMWGNVVHTFKSFGEWPWVKSKDYHMWSWGYFKRRTHPHVLTISMEQLHHEELTRAHYMQVPSGLYNNWDGKETPFQWKRHDLTFGGRNHRGLQKHDPWLADWQWRKHIQIQVTK